MRDIQAPPPDLVTLLVEVGPSTLVLVEGPDDEYILNEWYPEGDHNLYYHSAGGNVGVQRLLQDVLTRTTLKRAFGIVDRDQQDEAAIARWRNDPDAHLFIWPRYDLENYLLLPRAICEQLQIYYRGKVTPPSEVEVEQQLFSLCAHLCPLMAANWACLDAGAEYFSESFPLNDRSNLVRVAARKWACTESEAEQRITAKEALLQPRMATLEQAHSGIKGKHLLYHLHALCVSQVRDLGGGLSIDYFKSLLTHAVKRLGLHDDIREIMERRILA